MSSWMGYRDKDRSKTLTLHMTDRRSISRPVYFPAATPGVILEHNTRSKP